MKRGIGIIRVLSKYASRDTLDQMYKLFVRPHSYYGEVIYRDQNMSLSLKLESIQYEAALAVSGAWKGTNTDKLLEELGWETLGNRRWYCRLCLFYKIAYNQAPEYLRDYVPDENRIIINSAIQTSLDMKIHPHKGIRRVSFPIV